MPATMTAVWTSEGQECRLDAILGQGGEGTVYSVHGSSNSAIKILKEELRSQKRTKIDAMMRVPGDKLRPFVTWPTAVVYADPARTLFCGYKMPLVPSSYLAIHQLYGPSSRRQHFPDADWRHLVRAAENLCLAVEEIHNAGLVVGDMNELNVFANNDALIYFVDADSFQVRDGGTIHRCPVGVPAYLPPELHAQGVVLAATDRTPDHDHFALAVFIFRLLFMGFHPYAGRFGQKEVSLALAIQQGLFTYSNRMPGSGEPPPLSLSLSDVGGTLARYFEAAFIRSGDHQRSERPTAAQWVQALRGLESEIKPCARNRKHYYPGHAGECIWCAFRIQGKDYFPERSEPQAATGLPGDTGTVDDVHIARLWAAVMAVGKRPGFDDAILSVTLVVPPQPSTEPAWVRTIAEDAGCLALIGVLGASLLFGPVGGCLAIAAVAFYVLAGSRLRAMARTLTERSRAFQAAQQEWMRRNRLASRTVSLQASVSRARDEHEHAWNRAFSELSSARTEIQRRELDRSAQIAWLASRLQEAKRESYLRTQYIRSASIPGIADATRSDLRAFGFETAVDVLNAGATVTTSAQTISGSAPSCPKCGRVMKKRMARKGRNAGSQFWGCPSYPRCDGTRNLNWSGSVPSSAVQVASGLQVVPGIGPTKAAALIAWANAVDAAFRPGVSADEISRETQRIERESASRVRDLVLKMRGGPAELNAINQRFERVAAPMIAELNELRAAW